MTIEPHTGEARALVERRFEFCCLGNFAGHQEERPSLDPQPVNTNRWDHLFETYKPEITIFLDFEGVEDLKVTIPFRQIRDFRPKGLSQNVDILATIKALGKAIEAASESEPVDVGQFSGPSVNWLRALAGQTAEEGFVDLLSMVDIGEDEADTLYLKYLKQFFARTTYLGTDRSRVLSDLATVEQRISEQIHKNAAFRELEATWRGLYTAFDAYGSAVKLSAVDCAREELCDAFFLNFIRPEQGAPVPVDLVLTTYELDHHGPSLHLLHHLGRMAGNLNVPMLFNAAPSLLGARGYSHVSHLKDISGKFNGPAHTKWRKLRDEEGAEWLFAALNPWRVDDGDSDRPVWGAPTLFVAGLLARRLEKGKWPGELLGSTGIWDVSKQTAAEIDDNQAIDYAYEGIAAVGAKNLGTALMGMNMLADVKLTGPESLEAANFVEFTLPYRFFVGCASRYFLDHYLGSRNQQAFADYIGMASPEDFSFEEEDGQLICRFQAPFTIYGTQADMVIGAVVEA